MIGSYLSATGEVPIKGRLRCSFCNKRQDEVAKLIAGPKVFICGECVQACVDIIAEDQRVNEDTSKESQTQEKSQSSADAKCALCHMPVLIEEALAVESRGFLCRACGSAVQTAAQEQI